MAQGKRLSMDISPPALAAVADLAAAARQARVAAGEGQSAAAARLGVHVQTIGRIERGEHDLGIDRLIALASALGVSARDLIPDQR